MSKTALITGANRGIGRAIALKLADLGYNLFLMARDSDALAAVAAECDDKAVGTAWLAGELTQERYMEKAIADAQKRFGFIDVLINNAGGATHAAVHEADLAQWRSILDLNFNAALYLSRHLLPEMVAKQQGTIINISSISGRTTNAGGAIYSATKHALNGFSGCMYEDVRDYGVKVSTIMPGFVDTDLTQGMGMQGNKMIQPSDVAESVAYVLSASAYCCPTEIVLRPQRRP